MAHHVFISYSKKDKSIADSLCSTLEAGGVRCWITPRDVLPGMDWGEAIIDAIAASRVLVLLLTANSNTSNHVKREVDRAVNKNLIVIPFRVEEVTLSKTLEYHLSTTHWMDALTPPLEQHVQALAARIRQLLSISIATTAKTAPPVPAKRKQPTPKFPESVNLTIAFTDSCIKAIAWSGLQVFLDDKDIGNVTSKYLVAKGLSKSDSPDVTIKLNVQTTIGKHILAFKDQSPMFIDRTGSYELLLLLGGAYTAVVDLQGLYGWDPDKPKRQPFNIKLVREPSLEIQ